MCGACESIRAGLFRGELMRRVAVAVMLGGYACWAIGSGLGHQPVTGGARLAADSRPITKPTRSTTKAEPATKAPASGMKTVKYDGYQATVPDSWPVFNLGENPQQCVRYDINAVYLGTPGSNQDCPPELIGRADTITIGGPAGPGVHPNSPVQPSATKTGDDVRSAAQIDGHQVSVPTASASGTIFSDSDLHELALTMPARAPGINVTYGSDLSVSAQALASVRLVTARTTASVGEARHPAMYQASNPAWPASQGSSTGPFTAWNVPAPASSSRPTSAPLPWIAPQATSTVTPKAPAPKVTPKVSLTPIPIGGSTTKPAKPTPAKPTPGTPNPTPAVTGKPPPPVTTTGSASAMAGFETCTAPSVAAMKAWKAE